MDGLVSRFAALAACLSILAGCGGSGTFVAPIAINTRDIDGTPITASTVVTRTDGNGSCIYKLEFAGPSENVRLIPEIGGNRGPAQRINSCLTPPPGFTATVASNLTWFEEQTTYFWAKKARDYAKASLWITPPGWTGAPVRLANAQVDISVLSQAGDATGFGTACFPHPLDGCTRFWPGTAPKIFIKAGRATAQLVGHEFGHYAAGFVFGHMDVGVDGFDIANCAHRSFQEGIAETFVQLFEHHERTSGGVAFSVPIGVAGYHSQWRNECTLDEYPMAAPVWEAFTQSVWGQGATAGGVSLIVPWTSAAQANTAMANAFAFALAKTKGLRLHLLAQAAVDDIERNQPASVAVVVRAIFASHNLLPAGPGGFCVENTECASQNCDRGDGTSHTSLCVPAAGSGASGDLCTNHTQCESRFCAGLTRDPEQNWIPGTCALAGRLGTSCTENRQCASGYCDGGNGTSHTAECMPAGRSGRTADPCSNNNQCLSDACLGLTPNPDGSWAPGTCR